MGRSYTRLAIEDFGQTLLDSNDLDPIYVTLAKMVMTREQSYRWLLAYWCFYDAGFASYVSERESEGFWETFLVAAANAKDTPCPLGVGDVNGGWPRGKERRHFRGQQGMKASLELRAKFPLPEYAVVDLTKEYHWVIDIPAEGGDDYACDFDKGVLKGPGAISFKDVAKRVKQWRGFGDWISFKVGDMLERVVGIPVRFAFDEAMYADPHKAALMQWKLSRGLPQESTIDGEKAAVQEVVDRLVKFFAHYSPPPLQNRPLGIQEVETILCKWKSHIVGHYPLYNDLHEISHGVQPWAAKGCETAQAFLAALPKIPA